MSPTFRTAADPNAVRPPRAVVGSQISQDEVIFGAAFDRKVVRRFAQYVLPYRKTIYIAMAAVLVFTAAQLSMPLVISYAIDKALIADGGGRALLVLAVCFKLFMDLTLTPTDIFSLEIIR